MEVENFKWNPISYNEETKEFTGTLPTCNEYGAVAVLLTITIQEFDEPTQIVKQSIFRKEYKDRPSLFEGVIPSSIKAWMCLPKPYVD